LYRERKEYGTPIISPYDDVGAELKGQDLLKAL
jgi:hypothetical protein